MEVFTVCLRGGYPQRRDPMAQAFQNWKFNCCVFFALITISMAGSAYN